jgi:hypothetical protein
MLHILAIIAAVLIAIVIGTFALFLILAAIWALSGKKWER